MFQKLFYRSVIIGCFMVLNNAIVAQPVSQYDGVRRYIGKKSIAVMDSAKLRVTYSLQYVPDSTKPQQILKDRKILLIGDDLSHCYSHYVRLADSALTADWDKGKASAPLKKPANVLGEGYDIYFRYSSGKQTVLEPVTDLSTYWYAENDATPQWVIGSETDTVLSYSCQKATTHFRGRDWTVWFSPAIPLNAGPWKLRGLPGLILKAADSKGHYVFECAGIAQLRTKKQPIIMIGQRIIKCSREEYRKAQKQFYENYVNALLALGYNVMIEDDTGKTIEMLSTPNKEFEERNVMWSIGVNVADRHRKIPYNPIELE
jgi:GLPGLI family protein